jgi:hypothetical protein
VSVYRQFLALVESDGQSAGWYSWTASFWGQKRKKNAGVLLSNTVARFAKALGKGFGQDFCLVLSAF